MIKEKNYEKGTLEWLREQAKKDGFDNIRNWQIWKREQKWYLDLEYKYGKEFADWAKQNKGKVPDKYLMTGCKKEKEYRSKLARDAGYKNLAEQWRYRIRERRHRTGVNLPKEDNPDCSSYFSDITERIFKEFLLTIFECVEHMSYGNKWFDFICKNPKQEFIDKYPQFKLERNREYKIQLKSRCLQYVDNRIGLNFTGIDYNDVADYFILSGWNDRESLIPLHVWMFHRDDIIRGEKFWNRECFYITNNPNYLGQFRKYELCDKLDELRKLCIKYRENNNIDSE